LFTFLSKDPRSGNYLIRYQDEAGGWHSKSICTTKMYDALEILKKLDPNEKKRITSLSDFVELYL